MAAKRNAVVWAVTLEVQCPYCGAPQDNAEDGSQMWTPRQVQDANGARQCQSCEAKFVLHTHGRVGVPSW